MNSTQKQYQDDEIDLRVLLTSLWANKVLILAITAICSIAGIAYALLAPQLWSAKAIIVAPLPTQLEQLQLRLDNLVVLMDITNENDNDNTNDNTNDNGNSTFFKSFSETKLYSDFIHSFNSFDNKSEFVKKNYYPRAEGNKDANTLQRTLEKMAKNISVHEKKNEAFATLSFSNDNAHEAEAQLKKYINFIQTKETATKNKLLADKIANQTNTLAFVYQLQEVETLDRMQVEIARTEFALRISKAAGIETPVANLNNQSLFPIDLGAKALSEMLKILKEIKNAEFTNPALADIRLQLESLQAVPKEKVSFTSYHFLQSPSEPLNRDKPKRLLVIVLATLAGLMLGGMVALFRASLLLKDGKRD